MIDRQAMKRLLASTCLGALLVGCGSANEGAGGSGASGGASANGGASTMPSTGARGGGSSGDGGNGPGGSGPGGGSSADAPSDLLLIEQGVDHAKLTWTAPKSGAVDHYAVYRNGVAYATSKETTYTDASAPGTEIAGLDAPATIYDYAVAAVDAGGHEGPKTTQFAVYGYRGADGGSTWGDSDYSYGLEPLDWKDASGASPSGGTDVKCIFHDGTGGGFQPFSNAPQVPIYALEIGAFKYLTFDIESEHGSSNDFYVAVYSRLPFGDVYTWVDVRIKTYVKLEDGKWATVKIPLADLHLSTDKITASIGAPYGNANGKPTATLHVTSIDAGSAVDNGGFITGSGLNGGVYVVAAAQNAGTGTFTVQGDGITGSTTVASRAMGYQRSQMYKINVGLNDGMAGGDVFFDNIAFTRE